MKETNGKGKQPKAFVLSYPKSGRTWLRVLIGKALCEKFGLDEQGIFTKLGRAEAAALGLSAISYSHDGCGSSKHRHYSELETDKSEYKKKKVLFLVRDPRDTLVSFYLHLSKRSNLYQGSLSEFIRDDYYGIRKIVTFYNIWHANLDVPKETLVLGYEEMRADPTSSVRAALEFVGAHGIDDAIVEQAIAFASFENMKRLEEGGYFDSKKLRAGKAGDEAKVRRGVVGGYRDYLSPEDCRFIDDVIRELGCAFYPLP